MFNTSHIILRFWLNIFSIYFFNPLILKFHEKRNPYLIFVKRPLNPVYRNTRRYKLNFLNNLLLSIKQSDSDRKITKIISLLYYTFFTICFSLIPESYYKNIVNKTFFGNFKWIHIQMLGSTGQNVMEPNP